MTDAKMQAATPLEHGLTTEAVRRAVQSGQKK